MDGGTMLVNCKVDEGTDARGVGFASARIDSHTRQLLEHNVRRRNWEDWYGVHWWRQLMRGFWWISDYGDSTVRLLSTACLLVFLFANLYCGWCTGRDPGLVIGLFREGEVTIPRKLVPYRAIYMALITMAGFGDMRAHPRSSVGHVVVACQVLIGYLIIAALVTRLAMLFAGTGPAGPFS